MNAMNVTKGGIAFMPGPSENGPRTGAVATAGTKQRRPEGRQVCLGADAGSSEGLVAPRYCAVCPRTGEETDPTFCRSAMLVAEEDKTASGSAPSRLRLGLSREVWERVMKERGCTVRFWGSAQ